MHRAPAVVWHVTRSRFAGGLVVAASALVLTVHGAWWLAAVEATALQGAASVFALLAVLHALHRWHAADEGRLVWDGQVWSWTDRSSVSQPGTAQVTVDLQFTVLVRMDLAKGGRRWVWLCGADDPSQWLPMRRALFAAGQPRHASSAAPASERPAV